MVEKVWLLRKPIIIMSLMYLLHNLMICSWVVLLTIVEFFPVSLFMLSFQAIRSCHD